MQSTVRGVTLGWSDSGRGVPLLLLHAFPLDRRMWDGLAAELPRARLVTLDFRGIGESSGSGTVDDAADDAARLLDHLGIERAVVGGLSMGGYVALAFVARHRQRLAGLLLADTRAAPDSPEGRKGRDDAIARVAREGAGGYVAELVPRLLAVGSTRAAQLALAISSSQSVTGVAGALAALRDRPDRSALLADIDVPTTVIVGAEDRITPPAEAHAMAAAIPGARLVEIAGAGHLANLEAPRAFADAVDELLGRVAVSRG